MLYKHGCSCFPAFLIAQNWVSPFSCHLLCSHSRAGSACRTRQSCVKKLIREPLLHFQKFCWLIVKNSHYSKINYVNLQLSNYIKKQRWQILKIHHFLINLLYLIILSVVLRIYIHRLYPCRMVCDSSQRC